MFSPLNLCLLMVFIETKKCAPQNQDLKDVLKELKSLVADSKRNYEMTLQSKMPSQRKSYQEGYDYENYNRPPPPPPHEYPPPNRDRRDEYEYTDRDSRDYGPPPHRGPPPDRGPPHHGPPPDHKPPHDYGPPHHGPPPDHRPPHHRPPPDYGPPHYRHPPDHGPPPYGPPPDHEPPHHGPPPEYRWPPDYGPSHHRSPPHYGPPPDHGPPHHRGPPPGDRPPPHHRPPPHYRPPPDRGPHHQQSFPEYDGPPDHAQSYHRRPTDYGSTPGHVPSHQRPIPDEISHQEKDRTSSHYDYNKPNKQPSQSIDGNYPDANINRNIYPSDIGNDDNKKLHNTLEEIFGNKKMSGVALSSDLNHKHEPQRKKLSAASPFFQAVPVRPEA